MKNNAHILGYHKSGHPAQIKDKYMVVTSSPCCSLGRNRTFTQLYLFFVGDTMCTPYLQPQIISIHNYPDNENSPQSTICDLPSLARWLESFIDDFWSQSCLVNESCALV